MEISEKEMGKLQEEAGKKNRRSSYKERRENALASGAEEGRGKQRNAAASRKQTTTRGNPNGEIRRRGAPSFYTEHIGIGGEAPELKHLSRARKRNQPRFPK